MPGEIWEELEALWDFVTGTDDRESLSIKPPINVFESDEYYLVQVALAGVLKADVEVKFTDGTLVVRGKRKDPLGNLKRKYHSLEIFFGSFERRIPITGKIKKEKIRMSFKNGLLEIKIPKVRDLKKPEE